MSCPQNPFHGNKSRPEDKRSNASRLSNTNTRSAASANSGCRNTHDKKASPSSSVSAATTRGGGTVFTDDNDEPRNFKVGFAKNAEVFELNPHETVLLTAFQNLGIHILNFSAHR